MIIFQCLFNTYDEFDGVDNFDKSLSLWFDLVCFVLLGKMYLMTKCQEQTLQVFFSNAELRIIMDELIV